MRAIRALLAVLVLSLSLAACKKAEEAAAVQAPSATHEVQGVVKAFREEGKIVVLQHENIPNLMEAMTMPFELADARLGKGFKAGDKVTFTLEVSEDTFLVTALKRR